MICENCKQRPAKVTVTQVQNGEQVQRHYCEVCAQNFHPFHLDFQQDPLSLHQLLSNWFGVHRKQTSATKTATRNKDMQFMWMDIPTVFKPREVWVCPLL